MREDSGETTMRLPGNRVSAGEIEKIGDVDQSKDKADGRGNPAAAGVVNEARTCETKHAPSRFQ
jgi:hypothetical protein